MNFKINDVLSDKIYQSLENIFEQIENYFKIKVTDETCFKENIKSTSIIKEGQVITKESDANFIRKEKVMYTCRALLQIQSVFFKIIDKMMT